MTVLRTIAVAAVLAVGLADPAAAHEGAGVLVVETREAVPNGFRYVVRLTWTNDGHPAADATMTATPLAPDGTPGTPVPLTAVDGDGRYQASVALPGAGRWTVRFTAVTPTATVEVPEEVVVTTTSTSTTSTTTTAAPSPADDPVEAAAPGDDDGGPGIAVAVIVGLLVVVGVAAGVALWLLRSARRRSPQG
jgi:hypothetical protein